jgi:hypothetical protein
VESSGKTTNAPGVTDDGSRPGCVGWREEAGERVEEERVRVDGAGSREEKGGDPKSVEGIELGREK